MPDSLTVRNEADGSFSFPSIEFSDENKGNTYQYLIYEISDTTIGGFTYDMTVYTVTVVVSDNGDNTITASVTITDGENAVDNIRFVNVYDAKDAQVKLEGTKILTGKTLRDGEFEFVIRALTPDAPMPDSAIVTNTADSKFSFGNIVFSKAGTYVYEITEKDGGVSQYNYDKSVYIVTIKVTDNSQGVLSAKTELTKNNMDSAEIVFRNSFIFTAISCDVYENFGGKKILTGRELQAEEFEFMLINARTGEQIGETVRNDADGEFVLPNVSLNVEGIYHFKIVEVAGDDKGITYDTSSFHIRIEVAQDRNGALTVVDRQLYKGVVSKKEVDGVLTEVTTYENITVGGAIEFNNAYKAELTAVSVSGTKLLDGRQLLDGEFIFGLYDSENVMLETVTNDADGNFTFSDIPVYDVGEYSYIVREIAGDDENIVYDDAEYTVVVSVTDNFDGTLNAEYTCVKGGENVDSLVFRNVYNADAPDTGDNSDIYLWIALWLASGALLLSFIVCDKRRRITETKA
jgi:pilin isopeptide linkage protein